MPKFPNNSPNYHLGIQLRIVDPAVRNRHVNALLAPPPSWFLVVARYLKSKKTTRLDSRTTGKTRVSLTVLPPVSQRPEEGDEPQQRAGEIHPHGILHALHARVALGLLVNVHLAKHAKQDDPQDEQDQVPRPDEPEAQDEGHQVQDGRKGGQAADDLGVDPFRILVLVLLGGAVQVDAVKPADGEGEGELDDVNGGEDHIGEGHAEDTHLGVKSVEAVLRNYSVVVLVWFV